MFTVLTDCVADMAKMVVSSVRRASRTPDYRWMRCLVHTLYNAMKHDYEQCENNPILHRVYTDFKHVKQIVEDEKRGN